MDEGHDLEDFAFLNTLTPLSETHELNHNDRPSFWSPVPNYDDENPFRKLGDASDPVMEYQDLNSRVNQLARPSFPDRSTPSYHSTEHRNVAESDLSAPLVPYTGNRSLGSSYQTYNVIPRRYTEQSKRTLACPIHQGDSMLGREHTCTGLAARNMSEVYKHLTQVQKPHVPFARPCPTCKEPILDQQTFIERHGEKGEHCTNPPIKRRGPSSVERQWEALFVKLNPLAAHIPSAFNEFAYGLSDSIFTQRPLRPLMVQEPQPLPSVSLSVSRSSSPAMISSGTIVSSVPTDLSKPDDLNGRNRILMNMLLAEKMRIEPGTDQSNLWTAVEAEVDRQMQVPEPVAGSETDTTTVRPLFPDFG
ncbi:hypothetical protein BDV95DRAFT_605373 [Massariosphaeria phaeospora]|uniref:Uncharacterized protein n=1 Tax=Massariosphaeria phaeospora TaxID=100035 RepID=A0A7C8IIR1_9PLEO|nr:hypothetical protein BDV95DRAFT_605373 [Massariosphaeria phaeospora]